MRLRARAGQTATEYMLVISVIVCSLVAAAYLFIPEFQGGVADLASDVSVALASGQVGGIGFNRGGGSMPGSAASATGQGGGLSSNSAGGSSTNSTGTSGAGGSGSSGPYTGSASGVSGRSAPLGQPASYNPGVPTLTNIGHNPNGPNQPTLNNGNYNPNGPNQPVLNNGVYHGPPVVQPNRTIST